MSPLTEINKDITNVVLFVSDALRWDFTPKSIKDMGLTYKAISSSLYTASSFPSIFSGLYPPKHGVFTWEDALLKKHYGLLDIPGMNTSLRCENTWTDMGPADSQIHRLCGRPEGTPLDELEEPFVYIEDDKGGHCPYGFTFDEYEGGGCFDFFKEYGGKERKQLIESYRRGIKKSINNFKGRLELLKKRGLKDNTLVIFTSDHGELLGEYGGLVNHGRPPCPELVYVPIVFIHPKLKTVEMKSSVARHVDMYPTILEALGKTIPQNLDGVSLFDKSPNSGFSFQRGGHKKEKSRLKSIFRYKANSVWDHKGGHVFHDLGSIRAKTFFYTKIILQKHPEFWYMRESVKNKGLIERYKTYKKAVKSLTQKHIKYGDTGLNKEDASAKVDTYLQSIGKQRIEERESVEMDEEVEKRLKSLGYMD